MLGCNARNGLSTAIEKSALEAKRKMMKNDT